MLLSFSINGYLTFNKEAKISFVSNKSISNKDFVFDNGLLKSAIIYGPNNTGKTNFINAISLLKDIIKKGSIENLVDKLDFNFFDENKKITFNIIFIEDNSEYNYTLDIAENFEITSEILVVDKKIIFDRNNIDSNKNLENVLRLFEQYKDKIVVSMLNGEYKKYTDATLNFFDKLIIIDKYLDYEETIEDMSKLTDKEQKLFNKIVKSADISIDSIVYNKEVNVKDEKIGNMLKLISNYKMNNKTQSFPSIISDSDGTQVFINYMIKIILLKRTGGLIVIDEIDKSLHTLLTKTLITIFNSEDNKNIQLLATSHDLLLLDSKYLFRKDQIWFTYKDDKKIYFYSLNDFKANSSSVRNNTVESYLKGMFGALPHPNIEEIFYE